MIILTGEGPDAFCSGGDQRIRGDDGYVGDDGVGRLNVLDLQVQIRRLPKPVIAMVAGYAIGGGHVLHVVCDLTICADNARFGQTGPKVGSFDGGYGCRPPGPHRRPEEGPGDLVPLRPVRRRRGASAWAWSTRSSPWPSSRPTTVAWCRKIMAKSPLALRMLKASFNADTDGLAGDPAAGRRRHPPLLPERGGAGGPRRLRGEADSRLRAVPHAGRRGMRQAGTWPAASGCGGPAPAPAPSPPPSRPVIVGTAVAAAEGNV